MRVWTAVFEFPCAERSPVSEHAKDTTHPEGTGETFRLKVTRDQHAFFGTMFKLCARCKFYRSSDDLVGKCKLFGDLTLARSKEYLCGKRGKWCENFRFAL